MTKPNIETEIASLNARLKELEAHVPIPASVAPPKPIHWNGLRRELYVMPYNGGHVDLSGRKARGNMKMAIVEAEKFAKLLGRVVKFVPWDSEISDVMVSKENQKLSWQQINKADQGHDAVLIVEELHAMWRGSFE